MFLVTMQQCLPHVESISFIWGWDIDTVYCSMGFLRTCYLLYLHFLPILKIKKVILCTHDIMHISTIHILYWSSFILTLLRVNHNKGWKSWDGHSPGMEISNRIRIFKPDSASFSLTCFSVSFFSIFFQALRLWCPFSLLWPLNLCV